MASIRVASGSIFDVVNKASASAGAIFDTTTRGIDMLDRFVSKASYEQELRHRRDARLYAKTLVRETAKEEAAANAEIERFVSQSPENAKHFSSSYDEFSNLFAEELGLQPVD